jgi:hypothetical protein
VAATSCTEVTVLKYHGGLGLGEIDVTDEHPGVILRPLGWTGRGHTVRHARTVEVGTLLVAAGLGGPAEHALLALLALNGLRVCEACGARIESLGLERGHRTSPCCARAARPYHPPGAAHGPGR